jgi:aspartate/methionine/tyrosine aminotransferase
MHVLLRPGDHVVVTFPGYQSLYEIAQSLGCSVSKWEPVEANGWVFDLDHLKMLLRPETRLVVMNFPHNPTGFVPSINDYLALINLIQERGIYLFSDEMYRFLERRDGSTLPSASDHYKRAFSLFGMSKTFGLPGLRIGWVVSRDKEKISQLVEFKDYTTICNSAPSEVLALIALQNRGTIINQQKNRINTNLGILDSFMESFASHFHWIRPTGGSVCFPRMLKVDSTLNFCERLVVETGIMLVPSRIFQYDDHHVRIGFGRDNFQEALYRFSDYLRSWNVA